MKFNSLFSAFCFAIVGIDCKAASRHLSVCVSGCPPPTGSSVLWYAPGVLSRMHGVRVSVLSCCFRDSRQEQRPHPRALVWKLLTANDGTYKLQRQLNCFVIIVLNCICYGTYKRQRQLNIGKSVFATVPTTPIKYCFKVYLLGYLQATTTINYCVKVCAMVLTYKL